MQQHTHFFNVHLCTCRPTHTHTHLQQQHPNTRPISRMHIQQYMKRQTCKDRHARAHIQGQTCKDRHARADIQGHSACGLGTRHLYSQLTYYTPKHKRTGTKSRDKNAHQERGMSKPNLKIHVFLYLMHRCSLLSFKNKWREDVNNTRCV